jgi:hypothetical protein
MRVTGFDERYLVRDRPGTHFVVSIYQGGSYEGGGQPDTPWSVDSHLLTDTEFTEVLGWVRENLPREACYSVGVVIDPAHPTVDSDLDVSWVLGADVLNKPPRYWTSSEQLIAKGMLARRHRDTPLA